MCMCLCVCQLYVVCFCVWCVSGGEVCVPPGRCVEARSLQTSSHHYSQMKTGGRKNHRALMVTVT